MIGRTGGEKKQKRGMVSADSAHLSPPMCGGKDESMSQKFGDQLSGGRSMSQNFGVRFGHNLVSEMTVYCINLQRLRHLCTESAHCLVTLTHSLCVPTCALLSAQSDSNILRRLEIPFNELFTVQLVYFTHLRSVKSSYDLSLRTQLWFLVLCSTRERPTQQRVSC